MNDRLEIRTLGGLAISRGGEPVTGLASRKVDALLVYLACAGRPRPREVLAELLWEERSQERAMGNLRVALSSLRKQLAPYVAITRDEVAIHPDANVWLDSRVLESRLTGERAELDTFSGRRAGQIEEAVSLYQGDFLEGFYLRGSSGFENWAVLERERMRAVYEQCLQLLLDCLLASDRWSDAIAWGERWIAGGQIPEPAYRALMNAYGGLGDLAGMTSAYQRCVEALDLELGVEPSDQTKETYGHLASGGRPSVAVRARPEVAQPVTADRAMQAMLGRWRRSEAEVLEVASLAVIYASSAELELGPAEADLLVRSVLHHGIEIEPWLDRVGSPEAGVRALNASLERRPKHSERLQIVDALAGLLGDEAAEVLAHIAISDDAPDVRMEAALAAAGAGRRDTVVAGLIGDVNSGREAVALPALVAVADEYGLPEGVGPYPKWPLALGLARRRWAARRGDIMRQMVRAAVGAGLALALHGMMTPLYMALAYPEEFASGQTILSAPAWMLGGALAGLVVGCILGSTSGFAVGLGDALWRGDPRARWRVALGGLAGLVHSTYLLLFTLMELFDPVAGLGVLVPVYAVYGVAVGMIISFAIPTLGDRRPVRSQLLPAVGAGIASALVTIPYVFLVYVDQAAASLLSRLLYAFLLPFGIGLALSSRKGRSI